MAIVAFNSKNEDTRSLKPKRHSGCTVAGELSAKGNSVLSYSPPSDVSVTVAV